MERRQAALIFLFFAVLYTLTNSFRSAFQVPDEEYVLLVTSQLISGKSLALPDDVPGVPGAFEIGKDGKRYSSYQIGQSLVYAPFFMITKAILRFGDPYNPQIHQSETAYEFSLEVNTRKYLYVCTAFFSAWACALFFLFACRLGFGPQSALIATMMFGLGTMVWPYSKYLFTEALQNPLLLATVYLLFVQKQGEKLSPKAMIGAGFAFGLLLSMRAIFAICLPLWIFYWFYQNKDHRLIRPVLLFGIPMLVCLVPQLIYDVIRFGNMFSLGYKTGGFTTPLYVGLFGYFLSPGKSFFLYTPISILFFFGIRAFYRRSSTEALLFILIIFLVPLKYAAWWVWSGDPSWGPRYLLVLTPFFLLPGVEVIEKLLVSSLWKRSLLGLLFLISFFVQLLAISVHYLHYLQYVRRNNPYILGKSSVPTRDPYVDTEFIPEYSPLLGQWWVTRSLLTGEEKPYQSAPWKKLHSELRTDGPLKTPWDFWLVNVLQNGTPFNRKIKPLFGAIALLLLLTIVGQELFSKSARARASSLL